MELALPNKNNSAVLALGAESAGNFSVYSKGEVYLSPDFSDLLEEKNWQNYKKVVLKYLRNKKIKPAVILTDLHPLFKTTFWGKELAQKFKAEHFPVQHHIAHIFSAIGDRFIQNSKFKIQNSFYGIACDGTGYGPDGNVWGGEIFKAESSQCKVLSINRIGHLENQTLIGGDLAIREPARMLIGMLSKVKSQKSKVKNANKNSKAIKDFIYSFVKKYYSHNQFELLFSQLQQNFNCLETSSTGRVLDAVSILLGFCRNKRKYKHEPIDMLEKNSGKPYTDLNPRIVKGKNGKYVLDTTYLFKYLLKYLYKDKARLAATAQLYIAEGLYKILKKIQNSKFLPRRQADIIQNYYIAGGLASNKIISSFLESREFYTSKKIPRGDAGLSFGQIVYYKMCHLPPAGL